MQLKNRRRRVEHAETREKKAREEMLYYKRELVNREENFNHRFNRSHNVGVMNVIKNNKSNSRINDFPNILPVEKGKDKGRNSNTLPYPLDRKEKVRRNTLQPMERIKNIRRNTHSTLISTKPDSR